MKSEIDTAYRRRVASLLAVLAVAFCALIATNVHAATPVVNVPIGECITVQHNGVTQFMASDLDFRGNTWNFSVDCGAPPPPANDPLATSPLFFKYTAHQCASASAPNGQDFAAVYGSSPGQPIVPIWPFRPNSLQYVIPAGKRFSAAWQMPANPGTAYHTMKGDPYAGACGGSSAGVRVNVSVIALGTTPAPTGTCSKLNAPFDGGPWLYLDPSGGTNQFRCNLRPLGVYRFMIQTVDGRAATMLTTWN
jgi:hypothetical protein